jgi:Ca-activated chloride channel homolog
MKRMYRGLHVAVAALLLVSGCHRSPGQNAAESAARVSPSPPPEPTFAEGEAAVADDEVDAPATEPHELALGPAPEMPASKAGAPAGSRGDASGAAPLALGRVTALSSAKRASAPHAEPEHDTEAYAAVAEADFARVQDSPLSTFSIDVDTASYSNVRRFLQQGQLPPSGAVRIEELINYFPFAYPDPVGDAPFAVTTEVSRAPWNPKHRLLHVGLQAKRLGNDALPPRNLVFLLDVSGSMESPNKLPLLKRSLATLARTLGERDQVAIVVYAGASGLVLPATSGNQQAQIFAALDRLSAGGSTNGAEGIELAYSVAESMARPGAVNRVILATDGDFNVGVTSHGALLSLIESKRKTGVFLSVLGFGMGNYKDSTLELLADKGNGNYAYIDSLSEARKVLVAEGGATLLTLAKDVKLQLEFNPAEVAAYRLIGYENRRLAARDFNDDSKDAGELGAGHSVTALYELVPAGVDFEPGAVDALKYQTPSRPAAGRGAELCTIKLRYKAPSSEQSRLLEHVVASTERALDHTSPAFRFSAGVAVFGMMLRQSDARGSASFALARRLAEGALEADPYGYRREFISLVDTALALQK